MSLRAGRAGLVVALCLLVTLAAPAPAASPGLLRAPGPVATVDTVAGPGFCAGTSTADPASSAVGAVAADNAGALWFKSDAADDGLVTTVLNSGYVVVNRVGPARSTGPAAKGADARPRSASSLTADGTGGVLVATSSAILQLDKGLMTVAGASSPTTAPAGLPGSASVGDGGPLRAARFTRITAVTADRAGNVYVADEIEPAAARISLRFLNRSNQPVTFYPGTPDALTVPAGMIDTIAGSVGSTAGSGPVGSSVEAVAPALAVAQRRLYLTAALGGPRPRAQVRMLNLAGTELSAHGVTLAAGAWEVLTEVVGGAGAFAVGVRPVSALSGIAADREGNLFLAEQANHRISRLDPAGTVATVAGTGVAGFDGNDLPAVQARLDRPVGVAIGSGGRLFISDAGNAQVRVVDRAGTIRAALGNGAALRWTCAAGAGAGSAGAVQPETARVGKPDSLTADASGNAYFASALLGRVYGIASSGEVRTVIDAGTAGAAPPPDGLGQVSKMTAGPSGALYLGDQAGVHVLNLGSAPLSAHGQLIAPGALAAVAGGARASTFVLDGKGNLLLADDDDTPESSYRGRVRQVDPQGTITTVLQGAGRPADRGMDLTRCCGYIRGLTADLAGNLYLADVGVEPPPRVDGRIVAASPSVHRVWFVNRSDVPVVAHGVPVPPGETALIAGTGSAGTDQIGAAALQTRLPSVGPLALDRSGNLYIVSRADHTIRQLDPRGLLTTAVGTGQGSFNGDERKGPLTALSAPTDVVLDACGNLLIADANNDRVRRLNLVTSCPAALAVAPPPAGSRSLPVPAAAAAALVLIGTATVLSTRLLRRRRR
ncbi:MAG: hypothetical protein WD794_05455 [Mycobacteriales bacterium]